ncbi:MAG TPA: hypothetical protein VHG51_04675 [Longimicrobiaceae bacterium]|nr:hypothetical protein [Longimicrobiaceae bacterium]
MSRSITLLRRALLGTACAIVFGFGGAELLAKPAPEAAPPLCNPGYRLCKTCTGQWYCAVDTGSCPPCELAK